MYDDFITSNLETLDYGQQGWNAVVSANMDRLNRFLSPVGLLLIPAIIHDFAYKHGYLLLSDGSKYKEGAPQKYWDDLFKEISHYVNGFQAPGTIAWAAVRIFGYRAWNGYRCIE